MQGGGGHVDACLAGQWPTPWPAEGCSTSARPTACPPSDWDTEPLPSPPPKKKDTLPPAPPPHPTPALLLAIQVLTDDEGFLVSWMVVHTNETEESWFDSLQCERPDSQLPLPHPEGDLPLPESAERWGWADEDSGAEGEEGEGEGHFGHVGADGEAIEPGAWVDDEGNWRSYDEWEAMQHGQHGQHGHGAGGEEGGEEGGWGHEGGEWGEEGEWPGDDHSEL